MTALLKSIARESGLSLKFVEKIAYQAPHSYRRYTIAKRDGGRREIFHPRAELKLLQSWISRNIIERLPVHDAALAYRRGLSIRDNALKHCKNNFLLKLDFENFFPSIRARDIAHLLLKNEDAWPKSIDREDVGLICRITCRQDVEFEADRPVAHVYALTIGAPSSPGIANAVMYEFDDMVGKLCLLHGVTYTRYADDLYFSTNTPEVLASVELEVRKLVTELQQPKLKLNEAKTIRTSRKRRRISTGLVLTSDHKISIGRDKKRALRSLVFNFTTGKLLPEEISRLRGQLAYVKSVEPTFIASLEKKFGFAEIERLRQGG
jgi:RNA-directed DNA polymerase